MLKWGGLIPNWWSNKVEFMTSISSASDCFQGGNRKDNILQRLQCDYTNHRNRESELGKIPERMVFHKQTANPLKWISWGRRCSFTCFSILSCITAEQLFSAKIHQQNRYILDTNAILTFLDLGYVYKHDKCNPIWPYMYTHIYYSTR